MVKIKRTCYHCGKLLRKADMYEVKVYGENDGYEKLCPKCFDKWAAGNLGVKDDK